MKDAELDRIYETAVAQDWEEQNKPIDRTKLLKAAQAMYFAITDLDEACNSVNEAAEALAETAEGDRAASLLNEMTTILRELTELRKKWYGEVNT